ncbi:TPA: type II toxin-antitoxin system RelE/ParE family toxin, partial [Streptococcus equi subsp. zooepidemicus]|nr:type II toxin-antitoxin system RelE/ParE family toxin [Streptococcus equi subsp. zooepidemicus]
MLAPSSAEKLSERIFASIKTLDEMPMRCRLCEHTYWKSLGLRFLPVDNYLVFYLPDEEQKLVKIYRIIYGKRNIE